MYSWGQAFWTRVGVFHCQLGRVTTLSSLMIDGRDLARHLFRASSSALMSLEAFSCRRELSKSESLRPWQPYSLVKSRFGGSQEALVWGSSAVSASCSRVDRCRLATVLTDKKKNKWSLQKHSNMRLKHEETERKAATDWRLTIQWTQVWNGQQSRGSWSQGDARVAQCQKFTAWCC